MSSLTDRPLRELLRPALPRGRPASRSSSSSSSSSAPSPRRFLTANNLFNVGLSNGEIAIMTLPMTLIIISGEIDLSVASILGMSSALLGVLWNARLADARHLRRLARRRRPGAGASTACSSPGCGCRRSR